ncbi:hypothetical protein [Pelagibacterium halotolerans]|uniref:SnoaL-like domain-containing protein n=1 Tax=Pelagibacterium halotolerans (strain DSM 22347 / JCM 15775 / CGMCC 1.7692 / B2) TaxID=1082931 RepID=G4RBX4_PELHB|nr:hypothetical protein [Pelagibacterium halotolerans]AEQ50637.1 hypothetical protein KKY_596 [Pelagibacterium halotolerans B2]QJR19426.1 hypothetical protein HKM20_13845 [Pelagibacterium halotolerans]SDZ91703.1 hypothetical protein SAMN05428936_101525 [Pelagibacterium halotolerans]
MKTKITLSGECGNSPKNAFAEKVAVAVLTSDAEMLTQTLTGDCVVAFPDGREARGVEAALAAIAELGAAPEALTITHAITHGRVGAVNGTLVRAGKSVGFAFFLDFKNAKADSIAAIRLYRD